MRRLFLGLVVVLSISAVASETRAQFGTLSDPATFYYSFYLPRQQAQSLQAGPEATINAVTANRQQYAATNRNGMFDPNSASFGTLDGDDFSMNPGTRKRSLSTNTGKYGVHGGNLNGLGPQGFYNSRLNFYYPNLRTGRGKNANVAVTRGRGFSGGGFGGLNTGLPGPR